MTVAVVRFAPGARTASHSHARGSTCASPGCRPIRPQRRHDHEVHPGQTLYTPPSEDHSHAAANGCFIEHVAMFEAGDDPPPRQRGKNTSRMPNSSAPAHGRDLVMTSHKASAARRMLGGFADKLADLTDKVLFGDISERPSSAPATAASSRSPRSRSAENPAAALPPDPRTPQRTHPGRDRRSVTRLAFTPGRPARCRRSRPRSRPFASNPRPEPSSVVAVPIGDTRISFRVQIRVYTR